MDNQQHQGILRGKGPGQKRQQNKHIQWDQEGLRIDDLERGKCQKIDEPKTPYHQHRTEVPENQQGIDDLAVKEYLDEAQHNSEMNKGGPKLDLNQLNDQLHKEMQKAGFSLGASTPSEDAQEIKKKEEFQKKRRQHYNQFTEINNAKDKKQEDSQDSQVQG